MDSAFVGDTLELQLVYSNFSDDVIRLTPYANIGITHRRDDFIFYEDAERIAYFLYTSVYDREDKTFSFFPVFNFGETVYLNPGDDFHYTISIKIKPEFFYLKDNKIEVYSHFYDIVQKKKKGKKHKRQNTRLISSFRSPPIALYVKER